VTTSDADGRWTTGAEGGISKSAGTSLITTAQDAQGLKPVADFKTYMSRADPLAPLVEEIERDRIKKERIARVGRLSLAWFMVLLMIGWVSKYAYRLV
jgi:hypothetical protein